MIIKTKHFNSGPAMVRLSFRLEQVVQYYGMELVVSWLISYNKNLRIDGDFDRLMDRCMFNIVNTFNMDSIDEWFEMIHKRKVS